MAKTNPGVAAEAEAITMKYERKLIEHHSHITQMGMDPAEILEWAWTG